MTGTIEIWLPVPVVVFAIFLGVVVAFVIYWVIKLILSIVTGG